MNEIKEVLLFDYTAGSYWRENQCGYTNSKYEAGLYSETEAIDIIKGLTERKMMIEAAPEEHPIFLKRKIAELEMKLASIKVISSQ